MGEMQQTWPAELDNDECAGPLQPDELARWRRSRVQARWWTAGFWVLWIGALAFTFATYWRLGDPAPVHVGPAGVDRWGSRSEYLIGNLVGLGVMGFCGPGLAWLISKIPMNMTNSGNPEYWKTVERYPAAMTHANVFLMATMTTCLTMILGEEWGFWELAHHRPFPAWLPAATLVPLACQLILGIILLVRAMRPPRWWKDCRHAHGHRWD